jgi:hypothetical protein
VASAKAQPEAQGLVNQPAAAATLTLAGAELSKAKLGLVLADGQTPPPVLSSFWLEQTSQGLRIIDADGSVYAGSILQSEQKQSDFLHRDAAAASSAPTAQSTLRARALATDAVGPQLDVKRADRGFGSEPAANALTALGLPAQSFRVTGTNLTLGRAIVFTGQLFGPTNSVPWVRTSLLTNLAVGARAAGRAEELRQGATAASGGMVAGKLTIGTNQPIDIRAVPAQQ